MQNGDFALFSVSALKETFDNKLIAKYFTYDVCVSDLVYFKIYHFISTYKSAFFNSFL
jgi:hypothetical protein